MKTELFQQEIFYKKAMGILAILYLIFAVLIAVIPGSLLNASNVVGGLFKLPAPIVPEHVVVSGQLVKEIYPGQDSITTTDVPVEWVGNRSWVIMAVTWMLVAAFILLMNFIDPRKYIGWVPLVLMAEGISSVLGLVYFFFSAKYFSSLLMPIFGLPTFAFILYAWLRARSAQKELALKKNG